MFFAWLMRESAASIRHELFIQADQLEDGLDDRELFVIIVDGEIASESLPDCRQWIAVAPQQPNAK